MPTKQEIKDNPDLERRMDYLRQYGNRSTSYFTLQPGLKAHYVGDLGYVAYEKMKNGVLTGFGLFPQTFVLSDPISAVENKRILLEDFLEHHPKSCFMQVSEQVASDLNDLGYTINQMGVEVHIDVVGFTRQGDSKRNLRQRVNHAINSKVCVEELTNSQVDSAQVQSITEEWLKTKKPSKELRFLTGPMKVEEEVDNRRFFGIVGNEIQGYVFFTPIYSSGRIIGYAPNITRQRTKSPKGITDYIILEAIDKFKKEGIQLLSFGYSPLANIEPCSAYQTNDGIRKKLQGLYEEASDMYNFRGLYFHKMRYRGLQEKVYFAFQSKSPRIRVVQGLKLCNLI